MPAFTDANPGEYGVTSRAYGEELGQKTATRNDTCGFPRLLAWQQGVTLFLLLLIH
jgi:hypothetical protein